jgi:hypothetical protein
MINFNYTAFNNLPPMEQQLIKPLFSPKNESSLLKGVSLTQLGTVRAIVRKMYPGQRVRVKYRGPRMGDVYDTAKANATSASIYVD